MSSIISGGTVEFECDDSIIVAIQRQASRTAVLTHVEDTTRFNIIAAAWNQAIGVFESATNQDTLREFSILGYPNMESSSALTEADFFCGETEHFTSSVSDYSSFLVDDEGMAFDPTGITQRTTICQINEGNDWKVRFEMIRVDSAVSISGSFPALFALTSPGSGSIRLSRITSIISGIPLSMVIQRNKGFLCWSLRLRSRFHGSLRATVVSTTTGSGSSKGMTRRSLVVMARLCCSRHSMMDIGSSRLWIPTR